MIIISISTAVYLKPEKSIRPVLRDDITVEENPVEVKTDTPFDTIFHFYKAAESNNWEIVKALVTPSLWTYLDESGFTRDWERIKRRNPDLKFVLFVVGHHSVDEEKGEAWVMGKAELTPKNRDITDFSRMIYLKREENIWKITKIVPFGAVETVDNFFSAINGGDFKEASRLTTDSYWNKLNSMGVVDSLKRERRNFSKGVYVLFYVDDYVEKDKRVGSVGMYFGNP